VSLDKLFSSETEFQSAFTRGLDNMLDEDALGAFILALANATFDKAIFDSLSIRLKTGFEKWQQFFQEGEDEANVAPDDAAVFRRLKEAGFDNLQLTQKRMAGIWQLQYNQLRSFRPSRNASATFDSIYKDFDEQGFHFNKPFLQKEILWQGQIKQQQVRLLYNKFPFAQMHGLMVINPEQNKPQLLTEQDHQFVWQMLESLSDDMPMGVGYNSLGAFSSVNHQHFQTFVDRKKLPVELSWWQHNGGHEIYPVSCQRFIDAKDAWQRIESLQQADRPYNLLYRKGELYLVTRRFQGSYEHAKWTEGFAWAETMGAITLSSRSDFDTLTETMVRSELQQLFV